MMIKGTLLVSLPIVKRFSVENFLSPKKCTFCSVFWTPWKNPGRISVKLTDNSFPVRSFVLPYLAPKYFQPFQRLLIK